MYLFNLRWWKPSKARHFYVSQSDAVTETGINNRPTQWERGRYKVDGTILYL